MKREAISPLRSKRAKVTKCGRMPFYLVLVQSKKWQGASTA